MQNRVVDDSSACKRFDSLDKTTDRICDQLEALSRTLTATQESRKAIDLSVVVAGDGNLPCNDVDISNKGIGTRSPDSITEVPVAPQPSHSAVNAEQFEILQAMIGQLHAQFTESSEKLVSSLATSATKLSVNPQIYQVSDGYESQQASVEASELSKSIDQLCLFASKKGSALFSEDAQLMIESLDKILAAVEHANGTPRPAHSSQKRKRPAEDEESKQLQTVRSIKRIRGLLNSAQSVAVNQPGRIFRKTAAIQYSLICTPANRAHFKLVKRNYDNTCDHVAIQIAEGAIGLLQKKSRLRYSNNSTGDDPGDITFESFLATVDYTPSGPLPKTKITAVFQQFIKLQNSVSLNPILSYCAMIPDDAKIFEYVNDDDVYGVRNLVEQGLASLSDCDSLGRPLLYVRAPLDKD